MIRSLLVALALLLIPNTAHAVAAYRVKSDQANVNLNTMKVAELIGEVSAKTARSFITQMDETKHLPGDRLVVIRSGGGVVSSGLHMIAALDAERKAGTRIVCIVQHAAHSMAFNLLTRCDVRLATERSIMLVHKIEIVPTGVGRLTAERLRELADEADRDDEEFRQANAKAMGMTPVEYDLFTRHETIWRAETLLKRGYLHGIATLEKSI